jgi:hypothetical protein
VVPPVSADPAGDAPEQPITAPQDRSEAGARRDRHLLAQQPILEREVASATEQRGQRAEEEPEPLEHRRSLPRVPRPAPGDRLLASYRWRGDEPYCLAAPGVRTLDPLHAALSCPRPPRRASWPTSPGPVQRNPPA